MDLFDDSFQQPLLALGIWDTVCLLGLLDNKGVQNRGYKIQVEVINRSVVSVSILKGICMKLLKSFRKYKRSNLKKSKIINCLGFVREESNS